MTYENKTMAVEKHSSYSLNSRNYSQPMPMLPTVKRQEGPGQGYLPKYVMPREYENFEKKKRKGLEITPHQKSYKFPFLT